MANIKISGSPYPIALTQSTSPNGTEVLPADSVVSGIRNTYGFTFASLLGPVALNYTSGQVTVNQKSGLLRGLTVLSPNSSSFASLSVAGGGATAGVNDVLLYQDASQNGYVGNNSSSGTLYLQTNAANRVSVAPGGAVAVIKPTSGTALTVNALASNYGLFVQATTTASQSYGALIYAGTNSSDYALEVNNAANTTQYFGVRGDGLVLSAANSFASAVAASTAWQFDHTGGGNNSNQVVLANGGVYTLPVGSGIVYVYEIASALGVGVVYLYYGACNVTNLTGTLYNTSGAHVNFTYNGSNYIITNSSGASVTLCISTIRLRTGN